MTTPKTFKAVLWMLGAVISFTVMAVAGREAGSELDTFELMMYRSMIGILVVLVVGAFAGSLQTINSKRFRMHVIRNVCHFFGQNLWFFAITVIPLAQVFAFEFSTPIWVALLAPIFLGEHLTKLKVVAVIMGFLGILIVAQPGTITLSSGVIAAALCAIGFAGTFIATKLLSKTETISCILFWLVSLQLLFGFVCSAFDGEITVPSVATYPFIVLVGVCGLLAHFSIVMALRYAPVTVIAPIDFLRLPIIAMVGVVFYNEGVNSWVIIGAIIVFSANLLNVWGAALDSPSIKEVVD